MGGEDMGEEARRGEGRPGGREGTAGEGRIGKSRAG